MKILLLFLFIGLIGVECTIYYIIPSELTGIKYEYKRDVMILFFTLVPAYFIIWLWCVCKKTYAKENSDMQWSKFSIVIFAFIFQITWFIVLSYFRNRFSIAFAGILASISFIIPILRIYEINYDSVKVIFFFLTIIQISLILWVSIEYIIYEKFITYSWIVIYYFYPVYITLFAALFVQFLRIEEDDII